MTRRARLFAAGLLALAVLAGNATAQPCPTDTSVRAPGTLLTVQVEAAAPRAYDAAALAALATQQPGSWTKRIEVAASGASPRSEHSITYGGVRLRDLLAHAGFGRPAGPRAERLAVIEAVATDGWRAVFGWGELFNHPLGDQVVVVTHQDGQPLDAVAGPLALRSLSDLRPGPRHVRNLCALQVRAWK